VKADVFIPTRNYQRLEELVIDLLASSVGVEMAAVIGRAGRGKTTATERIIAQNQHTVYVSVEETWSVPKMIRELAFRLAGTRPGNTEKSVDLIKIELGEKRRAIMVDEADRLTLRHLNALRDFHDHCQAPVVLIGEEPLRAKLNRERRLISRTRVELEFGGVSQADLIVFYREALDLALSKQHAPALLKHSWGDFRRVIKDALALEKIMKTSGLGEISDQIVKEVIAS